MGFNSALIGLSPDIFVTVRKRPLARSRRRWEDNIKMNLKGMGGGACTEFICLRIGTGGGLL
jgi:hypothetical protein